ncbi:hypothetical protein H112_08385 [Trichophyton rubrum D6]|uniref:Uncharacterized protein n=3 Tax=Trichophyton TaxID=5550 RepID=A0A080WGT9_TRIRC|nr:uncharacterized protein TERG_11655 [Trichophyton rubrum CBS 118892]EZF10369.1 hypothetical protein H100_08407 [Trichophyton rubrum MR850]EZF37237.1 hypothetical protein H102_08368 [Trichophyton rubrum CBS 100081]EZF47873.1 hypothetical protein H103_08390 [Trichophyton rubrum CBS 288.86]EZF58409.1 hypothetical protein H104_08342 [Trichophyton rubrum CBS 289.86]EZF69128.1 hypothetical protein H105_08394 [Trichophyton soudanense CBS 452.61]EZF79807.1 hypothetical protein H110_08392 [Trichophy
MGIFKPFRRCSWTEYRWPNIPVIWKSHFIYLLTYSSSMVFSALLLGSRWTHTYNNGKGMNGCASHYVVCSMLIWRLTLRLQLLKPKRTEWYVPSKDSNPVL